MDAKEKGGSFEGGDRLNESPDEASEVINDRFHWLSVMMYRLSVLLDRWFVKLVLESGKVAYVVILIVHTIFTLTALVGFWVVVVWIVNLFR